MEAIRRYGVAVVAVLVLLPPQLALLVLLLAGSVYMLFAYVHKARSGPVDDDDDEE